MIRRERIEEAIKGCCLPDSDEPLLMPHEAMHVASAVLAALDEEGGGDERERFEAWARPLGVTLMLGPHDPEGDTYADKWAECMWLGWQAALRGRGEGKR